MQTQKTSYTHSEYQNIQKSLQVSIAEIANVLTSNLNKK